MSVFPPASPQGAPKAAVAAVDAGLPTGGNPGTTEVILPGRASNVPANNGKFSK